jgi:hypothetical protein
MSINLPPPPFSSTICNFAATLIQKWTCCSGLGPGCQWSNYSWPGIQFPSVAYIKPVASPEFFKDFWVLIWCTFSQTGLFQDVPLPQPGILRESWKFVGCTSSQPGLFLDVPLLQPGMLRMLCNSLGIPVPSLDFSGIVPFPSLSC